LKDKEQTKGYTIEMINVDTGIKIRTLKDGNRTEDMIRN